MPSLRIEVGGQVVQARLGDAVVRVGRDASCDLRIDDATVSAEHLSIQPMPGGGYKLTDSNSGLPTKVNGLVVKRVLLKSNDRIEVGPARITFLDDGPPPEPPRVPAPAPVPATRRVVAAEESATVATLEPPDERQASSPPIRVAPVRETSGGGAPTIAERAAVARGHSAKRLKYALFAAGGFAVVALGLAALLRGRTDEGSDLKQLKRSLEDATALSRDDVDGALQKLDSLASSPVEGIRNEATREAAYLRKRIEQAASDAADLEGRGARLDASRAAAEIAALEAKYGPSIVRKHAGLSQKLAAARTAWLETALKDVQAKASALVTDGKFAEALAAWTTFASDPGGEEARKQAEDGRVVIDASAVEAWKALEAQTAAAAKSKGPRAASALLHEKLAAFAGTSVATAIAVRTADYDREVAALSPPPVVPSGQGPGKTPPKGPGSAKLPAPSEEQQETLEAAWKTSEGHVAKRHYAQAIAVLDEAAKSLAGTQAAAVVAARREDIDLARAGLALLSTTIREHPERFAAVEVGRNFTAALVGADDEFLTANVRGGQTQIRWSSLDGSRLAGLVDAAQVPGKESIPLAALLRETGALPAAEKVLVRVVEDGGDKAAVDRRLSRWRKEAVPTGGYVVQDGKFVSPLEKTRQDLETKITTAAARVASKDPKERKAAYDELLALGAPAKATLSKALRERRDAVAHEIAAEKAFTSPKTKARLLEELAKRRAEALALIENSTAYPYPYPPGDDHPGQKDVDRLVAAVREVWESPFDLVAGGEKSIEESMALVREVDEVLAKVEAGYVADLEAVKGPSNRAIDVPGLVSDAYDRDVLAYNDKVTTTATRQEKENVRIVNRYRMMMGRPALKIDERLVRAARGHSIEMGRLDYFAHESPTPGREGPAKRAVLQGYSGTVGENIAKGTVTAQDAFEGWFHSSGHHRNLLSKQWTEMGAGRSQASLWTQMFGSATGKSLKEPEGLPPPGADTAPEKEAGPDGPEAPPPGGTPGKRGGK